MRLIEGCYGFFFCFFFLPSALRARKIRPLRAEYNRSSTRQYGACRIGLRTMDAKGFRQTFSFCFVVLRRTRLFPLEAVRDRRRLVGGAGNQQPRWWDRRCCATPYIPSTGKNCLRRGNLRLPPDGACAVKSVVPPVLGRIPGPALGQPGHRPQRPHREDALLPSSAPFAGGAPAGIRTGDVGRVQDGGREQARPRAFLPRVAEGASACLDALGAAACRAGRYRSPHHGETATVANDWRSDGGVPCPPAGRPAAMGSPIV